MRKLTVLLFLTLTPLLVSADVVSDWNAIMQTTVATQNPFAQGRLDHAAGRLRSRQLHHPRLRSVPRHHQRGARCVA